MILQNDDYLQTSCWKSEDWISQTAFNFILTNRAKVFVSVIFLITAPSTIFVFGIFWYIFYFLNFWFFLLLSNVLVVVVVVFIFNYISDCDIRLLLECWSFSDNYINQDDGFVDINEEKCLNSRNYDQQGFLDSLAG